MAEIGWAMTIFDWFKSRKALLVRGIQKPQGLPKNLNI